MQKGINLTIKEMKENLVSVINGSNLPISVIEMVLRDISAEASMANNQAVEKERQEYNAGIEESKTEAMPV